MKIKRTNFCHHYFIPLDETITAETKDFHFECGFCHKEKIIPNDRIYRGDERIKKIVKTVNEINPI